MDSPATEVKKVRRCAFYLRVSDDDGNKEENSIDAQRFSCQAYVNLENANQEPMQLVEELVDLGASGKDLERPGMQGLLAMIRARQIDVVMVYKIDRLSRSLLDFCRLTQEFKKDGVELISSTQKLDSSTPHGRAMIHILVTFAQYEREVIQERTTLVMHKRAREGRWNGQWIPYGYDRTEEKTIVPNSTEAPIVKQIFEWALTGDSPERIAARLKKGKVLRKLRTFRRKGQAKKQTSLPRPFDSEDIRRILLNPLYAGYVKGGGQLYKSLHEGLVSVEDWERVVALVKRAPRTRAGVVTTKHHYLLNGRLWCGCCGSPMTGYRTGKNDHHYYACQRHRRGTGAHACQVKNLPVAALDEFAVRLLSEVARLPEMVEAFVELARQGEASHAETQKALNATLAALDALRGQKHRIRREITACDSKPLLAEWRLELKGVSEKEAALEAEAKELSAQLQDADADGLRRQQIATTLGEAKSIMESLPKETRDEMLQSIVRKIVVNVPDAVSAAKGGTGLDFRPVDEKGRYLLNVQFSESALASMFSKHCADRSIKLGDWLPGLGSNQRPSD